MAFGSCGAGRLADGGKPKGWGSIRLTTTFEGIVYAQDVDVWDLNEAMEHGPDSRHEVTLGGRRYVSHKDEPVGLPAGVHLAFWTALWGIGAWMDQAHVTRADVLQWGLDLHEAARARIQRVARQRRQRTP
jgi:hypothetical protein